MKQESIKNKISKLNLKLEDLNDKLFNAKIESSKKINNLGWGASMRRSKVSVSFTKEDRIKDRIDKIKQEINLLKEQLSLI